MKYIGWEKRDVPRSNKDPPWKNEGKKIIEIYVFNNPEIRKYDTGVTALGAIGDNCAEYEIQEGILNQIPSGAGFSKGFLKDCFCEINGDIKGLSEKIGISNDCLEKIIFSI